MFRHVYENMYIYRYIYYIYIYIYRSRIVVVCRIYTTFDVNIAILKLKPKPSKIFGVATFTDKFMVLILDGIPEIFAYVGNNLCYLICLRHYRGQSQIGFSSPKGPIILHACATCSELPSNISTMG